MRDSLPNRSEKPEVFIFGTFKELEPILDQAIGIIHDRLARIGESPFFYSENRFILSIITQKREHLLHCLEDDFETFASRFEEMGREFYDEKIPYIDFIKAFSTLKELLIEIAADEDGYAHLIKEIYFLAKASLSHTSKGYLLSMIDADIESIEMLIHKNDDEFSDDEASLKELLGWFYSLLLQIKEGKSETNIELKKCDVFLVFEGLNHFDETYINREHLEDMHKRLNVDAQSILFYLDQKDFSGMLPVYSSLLNIYKASLYLMNSHQMKKQMAWMEMRENELNQLNRRLKESNDIWQAIMNASLEAVYVMDLDGVVVSCNEAGALRFDTPVREMIGKNILGFFPDTIVQYCLEVMQRVIQTKQPVRFEDEMLGLHLNNAYYPVLDEQGNVEKIVVLSLDVSERKKTEKALEESEKRLNTFFEASFEGLLFHHNGTILDVNSNMIKISGYSADEIIGRNLLDFVTPESRETVAARMIEGFEGVYEINVKDKTGKTIPVEVRSRAFEMNGQKIRVASLHDITQRKKTETALRNSEHHLQAIIENEPECVKLVDTAGRLIDMNPAGLAMLEAKTLEEVQRHPLTSYILPQWRAPFIALHKQVMKGENALLEFEVKGLKGARRWLETHAVPMRDSEGKIISLLGITRDITQRKEKEAELQKHKDNLEQLVEERTRQLSEANRAKSIFLANMSHEIRTPMNAVIGFNELLLRSEITELQKGYLEKSKNAANALLSLISDILDFSKIEAGKLIIANTLFRPLEIVRQVVDILQLEAQKRGLKLEYEVEDSQCELLMGDPERIRQVLINLIGNALKFTDSGSVHVAVFVSSLNTHTCTLEFAVTDTGIGISPAQQEKLFELFSQVDNSTTRKEGGTGLGLAISKQLVEAMGGTIEVESEEGEGSTFSFTLTLELPDMSILLNQENEYSFNFNGLTILLTEDNEDNREVAFELLRHMGVNVDIACNGQEAVEMVRAKKYDMVLMDIQMPIMDGLNAAKIMRNEGCAVPIIALSAYTSAEEQQFSLNAGMNAHLIKPFNTKDIQNLLMHYFPERATIQPDTSLADKPCWVKELPTFPGLDFNDALCGYWLRKEDFLEKIPCFIENIRDESIRLHSMIDEDNHAEALNLLHKLKGSVKLYGAKRIFDAIVQLETRVQHEATKPLMDAFDDAVLELVQG